MNYFLEGNSFLRKLLFLSLSISLLILIVFGCYKTLKNLEENTNRISEQVEFVDAHVSNSLILGKKYTTVVKYNDNYYELNDKNTYYNIKDNNIDKNSVIYAEFEKDLFDWHITKINFVQ